MPIMDIQGHQEYFRTSLTDGNGVSNLTKTVNAMWEWIK